MLNKILQITGVHETKWPDGTTTRELYGLDLKGEVWALNLNDLTWEWLGAPNKDEMNDD